MWACDGPTSKTPAGLERRSRKSQSGFIKTISEGRGSLMLGMGTGSVMPSRPLHKTAQRGEKFGLAAAMNIRPTLRFLLVFSCLFVSVGWWGKLWGQQINPPALPLSPRLLTQISDIHALSENEAERGYPVRIRGVVTYYGGPPVLFIQDSTGGIYVEALADDLGLTAGELVEVRGVTTHGWFRNQIEKPKIHVLGRALLPEPRRPRIEELAVGREDSQWVEVAGIVHSTQIEEPSKKLILSLAIGSGRVKVVVQNYSQSALTTLPDSKIQIQGACGGVFNPKHQLVGIVVYVQDIHLVRVLEPPPLTAESPPVESIRRPCKAKRANHLRPPREGPRNRDSAKALPLPVHHGRDRKPPGGNISADYCAAG